MRRCIVFFWPYKMTHSDIIGGHYCYIHIEGWDNVATLYCHGYIISRSGRIARADPGKGDRTFWWTPKQEIVEIIYLGNLVHIFTGGTYYLP